MSFSLPTFEIFFSSLLFWSKKKAVAFACSSSENPTAEKWLAGYLTSALKKAVRPKCQAGNANTTLYVDLWNQAESKLLPNITEYLWTSPHTTQSILRNVLKARYGRLRNMNMAYVQTMPYIRGLRTATSNACPLCSLEDSGSHLRGGCRHQDMVKSYIARHNEAGRLILKAITHLPPWLAQETTISQMRQDGEERNRTADSLGITAPGDRLKMRPDIMMVDLTTNDLGGIESRAPKKCKADEEQTTLQDMIDR